jgi:flagellar assembly factor FliW
MKLDTKHFGEIEIDEEKIISFPEGIPGFEDQKRFVIINNNDSENPFDWLQAVDKGSLSFVIINPFLVKPDYDFALSKSVEEKLKIENEKDVAVYTIAVIPEDIKKITINLSGPVIINAKEKLGKQIILNDERYSTKYYIFGQDQNCRGE